MEEREDHGDRLDFVQKQLSLLTEDMKKRIQQITEEVKSKVSSAMKDEIYRLSPLVEDFSSNFHPFPEALKTYKNELNQHIEKSMGKKLAYRCTNAVNASMQKAQEEMIDHVKCLMPPEVRHELPYLIPCKMFDLSYDLNCEKLCSDFEEDIEFQFSLGWSSVINRYLGSNDARRILLGFAEPMFQIPRPLACTPSDAANIALNQQNASQEEHMASMVAGLASLTSRTSMSVIIVGGVVWKTVGWKLIALSLGMYGGLYLFERLTWTTKAKERKFKEQFVNYATDKLKMIVSYTSSNCSRQVEHYSKDLPGAGLPFHSYSQDLQDAELPFNREMCSSFSQLCNQVSITQKSLTDMIGTLSKQIELLEKTRSDSKVLRNDAIRLEEQLDVFAKQFLHQNK